MIQFELPFRHYLDIVRNVIKILLNGHVHAALKLQDGKPKTYPFTTTFCDTENDSNLIVMLAPITTLCALHLWLILIRAQFLIAFVSFF